jgi:hypothetical protein
LYNSVYESDQEISLSVTGLCFFSGVASVFVAEAGVFVAPFGALLVVAALLLVQAVKKTDRINSILIIHTNARLFFKVNSSLKFVVKA